MPSKKNKFQETSDSGSESEETFKMSSKYTKLLDYKNVLKKTKNKKDLLVTLKKSSKGVGLYATKNIKKDTIIAYYKIRVFKLKGYESPTNSMYSFDVYDKDDESKENLIGDIDLSSFPKPIDNITFWAPFANEPSLNQKSNAEVDTNIDENYINRKKVGPGDTLIYKLVATRNIKKGAEILWYYGPDYDRDYETSAE